MWGPRFRERGVQPSVCGEPFNISRLQYGLEVLMMSVIFFVFSVGEDPHANVRNRQNKFEELQVKWRNL